MTYISIVNLILFYISENYKKQFISSFGHIPFEDFFSSLLELRVGIQELHLI